MIESKKRAAIFFLLAFVLALIVGFLVYEKIKELNDDLGGMTEIYVADTDIPSRTLLNENQFTIMKIPNKFVTDSHITSFSKMENRVSVVPLSEGDLITEGMIKPLSNLQDEDNRLVSIQRDENVQFDQVIEALDRVDIIVSSDDKTTTFLSDIPVVYAQGADEKFSGIAVEVSKEDAEKLIHQQNYAEYIRILKANVGKSEGIDEDTSEEVEVDDEEADAEQAEEDLEDEKEKSSNNEDKAKEEKSDKKKEDKKSKKK